MGIKSLSKFLRETFPQIYEEIHISEYAYKKVAIDVSLYLCNFKVTSGDRWLEAFINMVACLRKNQVHCVFIFDSGYPPEKEAERQERQQARAKLEKRVFDLENALEEYHNSGEIDKILLDLQNKHTAVRSSFLHPTAVVFKEDVVSFYINKLKRQLFQISSDDYKAIKELFDILNVPFYHAPLEAETMCADLCKRGLVDAVLTEDTDVLAYGCPVSLTKFNMKTETCSRIIYDRLLELMNLNYEQFLDFCIVCGTDYNKNIFRVGPAKAYKYMLDYGNIETMSEKTSHDISILNHLRGRELFKDYDSKECDVKFCGRPDFDRLTSFLAKRGLFASRLCKICSENVAEYVQIGDKPEYCESCASKGTKKCENRLYDTHIERLKTAFMGSEIVFEG